MSAHALRTALSLPATDATLRHLSDLCSQQILFPDDFLPELAVTLLQKFCDESVETLMRRWFGLLLCKLIRTSAGVVAHLQANPRQLQKIGPATIRGEEWEDLRLIGGLIMREALVHGTPFTQLWPTPRIPNNSVFPAQAGGTWMKDFQTWLDDLVDVKLAKFSTDPAILFPLYLRMEPDFTAVRPMLLFQRRMLTVVCADSEQHRLRFLDTPLPEVQHIDMRRMIVHDSQGEGPAHETSNVHLTMSSGGAIFLDASRQTGAKTVTIFFESPENASECRDCVMEGRAKSKSQNRKTRRRMHSGRELITLHKQNDASSETEGTLIRSCNEAKADSPGEQRATNMLLAVPKCGRSAEPFREAVPGSWDQEDAYEISASSARMERREASQVWATKNGRLGKSFLKKPEGRPTSETKGSAYMAAHDREDGRENVVTRESQNKLPDQDEAPAPDMELAEDAEGELRPINGQCGADTQGERARNAATKYRSSDDVYKTPSDVKLVQDTWPPICKSKKSAACGVEQEPRRRCKVVKKVAHRESKSSESSESDGSGSGHVQGLPKPRQTGVRRPYLVPKTVAKKSEKTTKAKARGSKKRDETVVQFVSPQKHPVLANLVSTSRPKEGSTTHSTPPTNKQTVAKAIAPTRGQGSKEALCLSTLTAETRTLDRLKNVEGSDGDEEARDKTNQAVETHPLCDSATKEENLEHPLPGNPSTKSRPHDGTPMLAGSPRTPKRASKQHPLEPPQPMAPPKCLDGPDPSSPFMHTKYNRALRGDTTTSCAGPRGTGPQMLPPTYDQSPHTTPVPKNTSRRPPRQRAFQRTASQISLPGELLSSNSKPLPAEPHAESTAISGHAETEDVDFEKATGDRQTARSDPFRRRTVSANGFLSRLTTDPRPLEEPVLDKDLQHDAAEDETEELYADTDMLKTETTLVATEDGSLPVRDTPTHYPSSPPQRASGLFSSSYSSAYFVPAAPSDRVPDSTLINPEDEDDEWEASLRPHQRAMSTRLQRITRSVLQHIADSETAVDNAVELYAIDGAAIVKDFRKRRAEQFEKEMEGVRRQAKMLKRELNDMSGNLAKERKRLDEVPKWLSAMAE